MTFAGTQNCTSDIVFKKDPKLYRYPDYSTTLFKQMYKKKGWTKYPTLLNSMLG